VKPAYAKGNLQSGPYQLRRLPIGVGHGHSHGVLQFGPCYGPIPSGVQPFMVHSWDLAGDYERRFCYPRFRLASALGIAIMKEDDPPDRRTRPGTGSRSIDQAVLALLVPGLHDEGRATGVARRP